MKTHVIPFRARLTAFVLGALSGDGSTPMRTNDSTALGMGAVFTASPMTVNSRR